MNPWPSRPALRGALFSLLLILVPMGTARAQESPVNVVAGGLINPQGVAFGSDGKIYIAEAGTGGDPLTSVPSPDIPFIGGPTGALVRIDDGCPTTIVSGLASARATTGETRGPDAVAIIGDRSFALVAGGGSGHGNPDAPAAVIETTGNGNVPIADLGAWMQANPVAHPPESGVEPDGAWSALAPAPDGKSLIAVESNSGQVIRISLDGSIGRLADLSEDNQTPTALAVSVDGMINVATFSPPPYASGSAKVIQIAPDGSISDLWTGLTMAVGLAIGPDGSLYAAEFSEVRTEPPYFVPGTGRIIHQTGPDTLEEVVTQVNFPGGITFGPDDALYALVSTTGADNGSGQIIRIDTGTGQPIALNDVDLTPPPCSAGPTAAIVKVSDYGFDPASLTVAAGSTVTWRVVGELPHAVASDPSSPMQWDSGVLYGGQEFNLTFDTPGTFSYFDGLYPDRTAEIIVQ